MKFLIAGNTQLAISIGTNQEDWTRTGFLTFRNSKNEDIIILTNREQLEGIRHFIVYIGNGFDRRPEQEQEFWRELFLSRNSTLIRIDEHTCIL